MTALAVFSLCSDLQENQFLAEAQLASVPICSPSKCETALQPLPFEMRCREHIQHVPELQRMC